MTSSADAAFDAFLTEYEPAFEQRTGLARHIATVAILTIMERGPAVDHWLEVTIERFNSATEMAYMTFAKTASLARALIHFGTVDGVPLLSLIPAVSEADDARLAASELVARVNINDALRRRVWRKAVGFKGAQQLVVLPLVEELMLKSEQGRLGAAREIEAIRKLLEGWAPPKL
jgi:hypothetical protein